MAEQLKYHVLETDEQAVTLSSFVRETTHEVQYSRLKHCLQTRLQTLPSAQ